MRHQPTDQLTDNQPTAGKSADACLRRCTRTSLSGYLERLGCAVERVKVFRLRVDSSDELHRAGTRVGLYHRGRRLQVKASRVQGHSERSRSSSEGSTSIERQA